MPGIKGNRPQGNGNNPHQPRNSGLSQRVGDAMTRAGMELPKGPLPAEDPTKGMSAIEKREYFKQERARRKKAQMEEQGILTPEARRFQHTERLVGAMPPDVQSAARTLDYLVGGPGRPIPRSMMDEATLHRRNVAGMVEGYEKLQEENPEALAKAFTTTKKVKDPETGKTKKVTETKVPTAGEIVGAYKERFDITDGGMTMGPAFGGTPENPAAYIRTAREKAGIPQPDVRRGKRVGGDPRALVAANVKEDLDRTVTRMMSEVPGGKTNKRKNPVAEWSAQNRQNWMPSAPPEAPVVATHQWQKAVEEKGVTGALKDPDIPATVKLHGIEKFGTKGIRKTQRAKLEEQSAAEKAASAAAVQTKKADLAAQRGRNTIDTAAVGRMNEIKASVRSRMTANAEAREQGLPEPHPRSPLTAAQKHQMLVSQADFRRKQLNEDIWKANYGSSYKDIDLGGGMGVLPKVTQRLMAESAAEGRLASFNREHKQRMRASESAVEKERRAANRAKKETNG